MAANEPEYPKLGLSTWPFHVVASEATEDIWVGRDQVRRKIDRLPKSAARIPNSQIVLIWASFGAGKTHALMRLRRLANADPKLNALYVVTPRGIRNFVDLYRAVSHAALESGLALVAGRRILLQEANPNSDVERALRQLAAGDNEQAQLAASWLRADKTSARDRNSLGLTGTLDSASSAIDGLQKLVHALQGQDGTLLLLLDEVQELADLGRKLDECVGGLHKLFDSTPYRLTLVLSFTTGSQGTLKAILGDTLWDRVGQTVELPALSAEEGEAFVCGLLDCVRVDGTATPMPFTQTAVRGVVRHVMAASPLLTPRALIMSADQVLREALPDLEDGAMDQVDEKFVKEVLGGN